MLTDTGVGVTVLEKHRAVLDGTQRTQIRPVCGDAGDREILPPAGLANSARIFLTAPTLDLRVCRTARLINPRVAIQVFVRSASERAWMEDSV